MAIRELAIGVYNQNFQLVFELARIIKIVVKEEAKVMEHPVEIGAMSSDHRIIQLVEIEMSIIVEADNIENIYKQIRQNYFNGTLFIVQTRANIYLNQLIEGLPHEEDSDMFDAISIGLKLKEFRFAETQTKTIIVPKAPSNSTTVDRGAQLPSTPPASILGKATRFLIR